MVSETTDQVLPASSTDELDQVLREYMNVTRKLEQTHTTLQQEVVRLRHELASKDQELERRRRLAALGELAAGVAHEVRNPLGAIQLYSNLLRSRCESYDPALELIDKIEAGIRAIEDVVQDTLALVPRGKELHPRRLSAIVEKARDVCLQKLQPREIALAITLDVPEVCVLAEEQGLQRVLVNLLANAAEVSPQCGHIELHASAPVDGLVAIRVRDEGPGLADEVLDRVFDPFFTTKPDGHGLGLTIARRLIEAYGGSLTAGNHLTGGAEFVIQLPLGDETQRSDESRMQERQSGAA